MDDEVALLVADVFQLAGEFRRSGEAIAAAEGQTQARWQLLSVLADSGITVPRAARRLGITRQAVQRVANDLVGDGLVEFRPNPDHRASPLVTLTAAGTDTLTAINERAREVNRRVAERTGVPLVTRTREGIRHLIAAMAE